MQSRFNVTKSTIRYLNYAYNSFDSREDKGTTTTAVSTSYILPGESACLTMSVHIPADWNGDYHIVMRLKDQQGNANALLSYGEDSLRLGSAKQQDIALDYRLYFGAKGEERLALTVRNHAKNGDQLRLYAEMYLDSSAEPIYVDLPYYPELTSAGMTHNLDMPVSTLLNGRQAQKVELRILAAGADEPNLRNNQVTFYLVDRSAPLSLLYQPVDTTVLVGEDATFSVVASGGVDPYQYQWQEYLGGDLGWRDIPGAATRAITNVSGATESTLTVRGAQLSMNGRQYRCKVMDHNLNVIVSDPATLKVVSALPPTGDQTHLPLYLTLAAAALLLAAAARYARKKREQTRE